MKNILIKNNKLLTPQVIILKFFQDIDLVIDELTKNKPLIVNASNLVYQDGQRVIDFLSGYCFAKNGNIKKIDNLIYRIDI